MINFFKPSEKKSVIFVPPNKKWYNSSSVIGRWDIADPHQIRGWCFDTRAPGKQAQLDFRLGGKNIVTFACTGEREDVFKIFRTAPFCGFVLPLDTKEVRDRVFEILVEALNDSKSSKSAGGRLELELFVNQTGGPARAGDPLQFAPPSNFSASKTAQEWLEYFDFTPGYAGADANDMLMHIFQGVGHVTSVVDIIVQHNGFLTFTSSDPRIGFALRSSLKGSICLDLTVYIEPVDIDDLDPKIYIDYGEGYSERYSYNLKASEELNAWSACIPFPSLVRGIRLDPASFPGSVWLRRPTVTVTPIFEALTASEARLPKRFEAIVANLRGIAATDRYSKMSSAQRELWAYRFLAMETAKALNENPHVSQIRYGRWISQNDTITPHDVAKMRSLTKQFPHKPLLSIVMPTYNSDPALLRDAISSILDQTYQNFEICIADDCSTDQCTRTVIEEMSKKDARIKFVFREENGHISECSNSALTLASGEYIVLMDHDDLIPKHALWIVVYYINTHRNAKVLYSDEDKLEFDGSRSEPYFKGDFDNFLMYGHNLVSHLGVYATELVKKVGGFRKGYEGSQDYDLLLRCADNCSAEDIIHIPHVLYHWRKVLGSTSVSADQKNYAIVAAQKAINDHFERRGLPYVSIVGPWDGNTAIAISPEALKSPKTVAVIILTRDRLEDLSACVASIERADQLPAELIVMDNGSTEPEALKFIKSLETKSHAIQVLRDERKFNFSALNNAAAKRARSDILCFLNNDTEVLANDWLARAAAHFEVSDIGAVGAKLLYPDRTVQHFGVYLGMSLHKIAAHAHHGIPGDAPGPFSKAGLIQQFSAATAACLFVRRSLFEAVGGFDEALEVAYNDVDLCMRIRQAGYKIIVDPNLLLLHKESATRGYDHNSERAERLNREAGLMRAKWGEALDRDPFYNPNLDQRSNNFSLASPPRIDYPWKLSWPWQQ